MKIVSRTFVPAVISRAVHHFIPTATDRENCPFQWGMSKLCVHSEQTPIAVEAQSNTGAIISIYLFTMQDNYTCRSQVQALCHMRVLFLTVQGCLLFGFEEAPLKPFPFKPPVPAALPWCTAGIQPQHLVLAAALPTTLQWQRKKRKKKEEYYRNVGLALTNVFFKCDCFQQKKPVWKHSSNLAKFRHWFYSQGLSLISAWNPWEERSHKIDSK